MDSKLEDLVKVRDAAEAATDLMFSGKYVEAISGYNAILKNNLRESFAAVIYNNRGFCYKNIDLFEDACNDLFEAMTLYPDFPNPHAILGEIYREIGENENAQKYYHKALDILNLIPEEKLHEGYCRAGIRAEKGLQLMGLEVTVKYQRLAEKFKKEI